MEAGLSKHSGFIEEVFSMVLENDWLRNHDEHVTFPFSVDIPVGMVNSGQVSRKKGDRCCEEDEML